MDMKFDIITIFPDIFESFKSQALIARTVKKRIINLSAHNLRKWTFDAHKTVDDRPYGGGAGMVLMVEPIMRAVRALQKVKKKSRVILFSAKGKPFDQADARRLSKYDQLILVCGRYEGVDERVAKYIADEEISIGEYVLFGGEVPAMVVMEAVTRLLPGAVGKQSSLIDESFKPVSGVEKNMMSKYLEYPHYTRPEVLKIKGKRRSVPKVLLSGDHQRVEDWRRRQSQGLD
ncbi:MAG: tRNA (guanosine(37)-N1)-methyltransferase TrmD [Patescibacteria group bacterium]|nr:tRNA (guanosine(37)-N1)-methyltransferase TrmD [Patescibacteria group bacterium]